MAGADWRWPLLAPLLITLSVSAAHSASHRHRPGREVRANSGGLPQSRRRLTGNNQGRTAHRSGPLFAPNYDDELYPGGISSTAELLVAVAADPRLRASYASYLGVSPSRVVAKLGTDWRTSKLAAPFLVTEFRCHSNGVVYPVQVELPVGTRIFETANAMTRIRADNGDPVEPFHTVVNIISARKAAPPPAPPTEVIVPTAPTEIVQQGSSTNP